MLSNNDHSSLYSHKRTPYSAVYGYEHPFKLIGVNKKSQTL